MIVSRILRRFVRARIARHDARAKVFAAACVAAQCAGDRANAAQFHTEMCKAQAKRDGLIAAFPDAWSVRPSPHGDFEVIHP